MARTNVEFYPCNTCGALSRSQLYAANHCEPPVPPFVCPFCGKDCSENLCAGMQADYDAVADYICPTSKKENCMEICCLD